MLNIIAFAITLSVITLLVGLISYKELFIKILFLNGLTNLVIVLIVILGTYQYYESYIDIAIIYACLSFVANQAILKFFISKSEAK